MKKIDHFGGNFWWEILAGNLSDNSGVCFAKKMISAASDRGAFFTGIIDTMVAIW
jgi:hypothetical protein